MPNRFEVAIREFDGNGNLLRSAMETVLDDDDYTNAAIGATLARLLDWITCNASLESVCALLGHVGNDKNYSELRKINGAYHEWDGTHLFSECVKVVVDRAKLSDSKE